MISEKEATRNFIEYMERERATRGLSVAKWAKMLGYSESGYDKIISGERKTITLRLIMGLYAVTGKYMFEFVNCEPPKGYVQFEKYRRLSDNGQRIADATLDTVYEIECKLMGK